MSREEEMRALLEALIDDVVQEGEQHRDKQWHALLDLDERACLGLVAVLQLVLRHPRFKKSRGADSVRELIDKLTRLIPPERPLLHRLVELGDNPAYDAPDNPTRNKRHDNL